MFSDGVTNRKFRKISEKLPQQEEEYIRDLRNLVYQNLRIIDTQSLIDELKDRHIVELSNNLVDHEFQICLVKPDGETMQFTNELQSKIKAATSVLLLEIEDDF